MSSEHHYYFSGIESLTKSNANSGWSRLSNRDQKLVITNSIADGRIRQTLDTLAPNLSFTKLQ